MAKGQVRSNKEVKKPKQAKQKVVEPGSIIPPGRGREPAKK
ncbi:hypothetical protein NH8B_0067 [Pseudogulbenkiania sp. NH8B]|jgi:hypothetical protein|uniref:Uncharacterized protein n=2 Tax=Pseudogulbenkiania TaxID=568394 RepID=A0A1Y6BBC4_9NEIS|nr:MULTISPECIES: hypothetical protein [Pseudogulbenkiania]EEG07785.1 hypothetical protein FuraDRAFT_2573 [Pseudogulbenkiania ferrooxidans 2002]BAK74916.1 hypothetical protein NH8B_0067 [Pseudogulbenkiania sp. NH8B]SME94549.1 hypothetical protein SAMN02745746_00262 [Pseudogulbenkiania subflava DSM 22618]HJU49298.1 hypothetical protein [Pseudogulbenkiania sp.]